MGGTERGEPIVFANDLGTRVGVEREEGRGEAEGDTPSSLPGDAESETNNNKINKELNNLSNKKH